MTESEVKTAFLDDLRALLAKWKTEIDVVDDSSGDYYTTKSVEFLIPTVLDDDENTVRPSTIINIGSFFHEKSEL